jgi:hypothetical protein
MPPLPKIAPQLLRSTPEPPTGLSWIKHDGHRVFAYIDRGTVRLITETATTPLGDLPRWLL